jgi:ubiquinone/menaquinone biosynthesis C-methylase UbiE
MLLNKNEFFVMSNPFWGWIQELIVLKVLRQQISLRKGKVVLEIGCGNGNGTKLIKKYFKPKEIYGIDLDPKMIEIAQKKQKAEGVFFTVGDAAKLPYKDQMFDAVFDFGVIHHIAAWKECLKEVKRVLKPGGQLIIEDVSIETFENPLGRFFRKFFNHPYGTMYKRGEFFGFLEHQGWHITSRKVLNPVGFEYFIVVAAKPERKGEK